MATIVAVRDSDKQLQVGAYQIKIPELFSKQLSAELRTHVLCGCATNSVRYLHVVGRSMIVGYAIPRAKEIKANAARVMSRD
jgi:hypothetical protein